MFGGKKVITATSGRHVNECKLGNGYHKVSTSSEGFVILTSLTLDDYRYGVACMPALSLVVFFSELTVKSALLDIPLAAMDTLYDDCQLIRSP
jgi:hypothetical protein